VGARDHPLEQSGISSSNKVIPFLLDEFVEWGSETQPLFSSFSVSVGPKVTKKTMLKKGHAEEEECDGREKKKDILIGQS